VIDQSGSASRTSSGQKARVDGSRTTGSVDRSLDVASSSRRNPPSVRSTAPGIRPGSPGGARPMLWRPRAAALGWRRRIGRTIDPCEVSPAGPANSRHYSPADRRSRLAPPKSRSFPCERAAQFMSSDAEGVTHHSPGSRSAPWEFSSENPSSIPWRAESTRLRSSIGQSQIDSSRPADAFDPATLPP
jgi:hypothetical protein